MFYEKSEKTQGKCPCLRSVSVALPCDYQNQTPPQTFSETYPHLFFVRAISQNIFKGLHVKNMCLFSKPNIYYSDRAVQEQPTKLLQRNTMITFRTLAKS